MNTTGEGRLPVDVVVVTWNSRAMVLRCLETIDPASVASVVVVDNASTDGTADAVRELHPGVDVLQLPQEQGLASAYNRGAACGSTDLALFLNDDVLVKDASLRALVAALVKRTGAVAAAGRLVDPDDGRTQLQYLPQNFPTLGTLVAALAGRRRRPAVDGSYGGEAIPVDQPPGACLLVRRDAFDGVGGWDEDFAFWYEDVDLARRLHTRGDVLYVPNADFGHVGGQSAARLSKAQVVARHYRGALLYAAKHFRTPSRIGAGVLFAVAGAVRMPFAPGGDSRRAYAGVLQDGLRTAAGRPLRSR